jgi:hypothetical protein
MKTTQAWGWLTAGVLALGLNGFYQDGGAEWAHQFVDRVSSRSAAMLELASGQADAFLSQAKTLTAQDESQSCRLATAMARIRSRVEPTDAGFARVEAMSAREQAQLDRLEASRARIKAQARQMQFAYVSFKPMMNHASKVVVACPRVRVSIPQPPSIHIQAPVIHVGPVGAGPV